MSQKIITAIKTWKLETVGGQIVTINYGKLSPDEMECEIFRQKDKLSIMKPLGEYTFKVNEPGYVVFITYGKTFANSYINVVFANGNTIIKEINCADLFFDPIVKIISRP